MSRSPYYDPQSGDRIDTGEQLVTVTWRNRQWVGFTAAPAPGGVSRIKSPFTRIGKLRVGAWRAVLLPLATTAPAAA